jgi:hypothetical protein
MDKDIHSALTIPEAIIQLLKIVKQLRDSYPSKKFTLDGRLVGDLGEILAETAYDLQLHERLQKHHDAITSGGLRVQIKATMQDSLTFPADHVPDYYLGIKIHANGSFDEVFNGPGELAWQSVKKRKHPKTNLHSVSIKVLTRLNQEVPSQDKIPRRERLSASR